MKIIFIMANKSYNTANTTFSINIADIISITDSRIRFTVLACSVVDANNSTCYSTNSTVCRKRRTIGFPLGSNCSCIIYFFNCSKIATRNASYKGIPRYVTGIISFFYYCTSVIPTYDSANKCIVAFNYTRMVHITHSSIVRTDNTAN